MKVDLKHFYPLFLSNIVASLTLTRNERILANGRLVSIQEKITDSIS